VHAAHSSSPGVLSWDVFIKQFERRFYPVTFLEKMKIDLQSYKQEKKSVTEYEVGFNKMVCFVLTWLIMRWRRRASSVRV
jgi:hypothetical protein